MKFNRLLISTVTMVIFTVFSATLLHAKILVVSPHPDDDIIMASGIVSRAVARGEEVRVVYMTNGDYYGSVYNGVSYNGIQTGLVRESEGVAGQSILGVLENKLMFLGYPDGYLQTIFENNPTVVYTTPNNNQSTTYGNRGLGLTDYHNYRFGAHASYTRANILADLQDIISSYQPDHILVTSEFDTTTDHATTYSFVRLATTAVCNNTPGYNPVIHKTIIWWEAQYWWPNLPIVWPNSPDPTAYLAEIPNVDATGLLWANRESFDVPLPMQLPNYANNPKALALNAHLIGQKGVYGYIGFFLHKDEVFWAENIIGANQPPIVNAGLDQTIMQGQGSGIVQLDGSQSRDPNNNSLTFHWVQRSGIPVQLSDPASATPTFTLPAGLAQNTVFAFELVVSDGQFTTLPDSVSIKVLTTQPATTNIAPIATVTASSESAQYGQTAVKAVDGVVDGYLGDGSLQVDGYPGDGTREWSTSGEKAGAWLKLVWPVPYNVDRIVLHDRVNLGDNITSATITFSDGSSIVVGPLNNNGTSTEYTFPPKTTSSLTMTVTGVSSTTYEIGLAEIQVYGNPGSVQTQYSLSVNAAPLGDGSISVSPSASSYTYGEQVTLTATPNAGYTFSNWSGGASGTANPLTITMLGNTSVTANFTAVSGALAVTPSTALSTSGAPGGPFTPSSAAYTLQNTGNASLNWSASATQSWVTLSAISGSLASGASTTVTVAVNSNANSLAVGSYSDTVTFTNLTNGNGNSTRNVSLAISQQTTNIAPLATVTASSDSPQYSQTAAKAVDGVIDGYAGNPGDYTREWATNGQGVGAWLTLNWSVPYSVNRIVLYDRPNLDDNITSATITFSDGSSIVVGPLNNNGAATEYTFAAKTVTGLTMTVTGVGSRTQNVGLAEIQVFGTPSVQGQYSLSVNAAPLGDGSISMYPSASSYTYGEQVTLTATPNSGYTFSNWSGGATGTANPLTITMLGNTSVTANFTAVSGALAVTPSTVLSASGAPGGPFTPSSAAYTLQNTGNASIDWSASATQSWITLSATGGSLASGTSAVVTVSINAGADSLAVGSHSDTVTFTNLTNGNGNSSRTVSLAIAQQTTNIAPLATVTASSDSPQYSQTASKAVDGCINGYPGDYTCEWATNGQGVGAWLRLNWVTAYSVNRIVLYDRPNGDDNITSATITFSDGSSIVVGPLNNNGAATEYTFVARTVTGLTMTVTGVGSRTLNVGLAEIQVFGN